MLMRAMAVAALAATMAGCATRMLEQDAQDRCAKKGKLPFLSEMEHKGVPGLADSATAQVMCVGSANIVHLPAAFGADAITGADLPGVGILAVRPKSVADKAGLRAYDVVFEVRSAPVSQAAELARALDDVAPGDQVSLRVHRAGKDVALVARF